MNKSHVYNLYTAASLVFMLTLASLGVVGIAMGAAEEAKLRSHRLALAEQHGIIDCVAVSGTCNEAQGSGVVHLEAKGFQCDAAVSVELFKQLRKGQHIGVLDFEGSRYLYKE